MSIEPALTAEEWAAMTLNADAELGGAFLDFADSERWHGATLRVRVVQGRIEKDWDGPGKDWYCQGFVGFDDDQDYECSVNEEHAFAVMAALNHVLPPDDPRKLSRADLAALETCGMQDPYVDYDGIARLHAKLAALLPPAE